MAWRLIAVDGLSAIYRPNLLLLFQLENCISKVSSYRIFPRQVALDNKYLFLQAFDHHFLLAADYSDSVSQLADFDIENFSVCLKGIVSFF